MPGEDGFVAQRDGPVANRHEGSAPAPSLRFPPDGPLPLLAQPLQTTQRRAPRRSWEPWPGGSSPLRRSLAQFYTRFGRGVAQTSLGAVGQGHGPGFRQHANPVMGGLERQPRRAPVGAAKPPVPSFTPPKYLTTTKIASETPRSSMVRRMGSPAVWLGSPSSEERESNPSAQPEPVGPAVVGRVVVASCGAIGARPWPRPPRMPGTGGR